MKDAHKNAINLLKTARGQIDAVINMTEKERYCVDIAVQITAIESLLKKANLDILKNHIETCVRDSFQDGSKDEKIEEVIKVLGKYMK